MQNIFFFLSIYQSPPRKQHWFFSFECISDLPWSKTMRFLSSANLFQSIRTCKGSLLLRFPSASSKTISLSQTVVSCFYSLPLFQLTVQLFRTFRASGMVDQFTSIKLILYQFKTATSPTTRLKTVVVRFFSIKHLFHLQN